MKWIKLKLVESKNENESEKCGDANSAWKLFLPMVFFHFILLNAGKTSCNTIKIATNIKNKEEEEEPKTKRKESKRFKLNL